MIGTPWGGTSFNRLGTPRPADERIALHGGANRHARVVDQEQAQPTVYYSHREMPAPAMTLFVRTRAPGAASGRAANALRTIDPNVPGAKLRTLESAFGESVARERLNALVAGAFALSGLLLASLGLYGLLAFLVTERTKDIGIRIALGA